MPKGRKKKIEKEKKVEEEIKEVPEDDLIEGELSEENEEK